MNIGPAFGIAVAAGMMPRSPSAGAPQPALLLLAAIAALGLLAARLLPGPATPPATQHVQQPAASPARRSLD